ncbi:hypothetical protein IMCC1989_670 [gamma proteobacterium IMCC1989]|nr:hypothetical protein IMCC1989_670 [gamma proteobacterium IMCC1989]
MFDTKKPYLRALPVGLALTPIGVLFGVLAAQENWTFAEVLLMSLLGFSGSGQFTYLGFTAQGIESIGYISAFIIILSINLRYIPMSLSATNHLKTNAINKGLLAHFLADESYAIEDKYDTIKNKTIIRTTIVFFWALSTSTGVLLENIIPDNANKMLIGLTFPVSAILILLSTSNVIDYCSKKLEKYTIRKIALALSLSVISILLLGAQYFWIPSIIISYGILKYKRDTQHDD